MIQEAFAFNFGKKEKEEQKEEVREKEREGKEKGRMPRGEN